MNQVNLASAKMFLSQCIGDYNGHMAPVAFSPVIRALAEAHGVNTCAWQTAETEASFCKFLRDVADQISPTTITK